jgi:UDP-N-acetylmuramoylalanine--D-glutamate ligase
MTILKLQQAFGESYTNDVGVLVLGLGESGLAMARWCHAQGARVSVADTRQESQLSDAARKSATELKDLGIKIEYGQLSASLLEAKQIIAISPGLSPIQEPVQSFLAAAKEQNIAVWGEIEFFAKALQAIEREYQHQSRVIAITGTNGKTTTTSLTGLLCEKSGQRVAVAGNISPAALDKLGQVLEERDELVAELPQIWVLELSSFQLEHTYSLAADAATVLNLSQDHLDWHGDMASYAKAKERIYQNAKAAVLNRDDPLVSAMAKGLTKQQRQITFGFDTPTEEDSFGIHHDTSAGGIDWLVWAEPDWEALENPGRRRRKSERDEPLRIKRLMPSDALRIKGRHNAANALAALALASALGLHIGPMLHALREYAGEPHRVQSVAVVNDVEYIDDSKGTNVGATLAALQGLGQGQTRSKIILLAGGEGKGQDFAPLQAAVAAYAKAVIVFGKDGPLIAEAMSQSGIAIQAAQSLPEAVQKATQLAVSGDMVLLSPACASFDMFKDYAHRAQVFVEAVNELAHEQGQVN